MMGRKKFKKIYILFETNGYRIVIMEDKNKAENEIFCPHNFLDIDVNFDKQNAYDIGKNIKKYINGITDIKYISFVSQGLGEICKDIEVPLRAKKREILEIINFEMKQFYNVNVDDYKIIYKEKDIRYTEEIDSQIKKISLTLFPKKIINFFEYIANFLSLEIKEMLMDVNIIKSYIRENMDEERSYSIVEVRKSDIVLAVVENYDIVKSIVITEELDESLIGFLEDNGSVKIIGYDKNSLTETIYNIGCIKDMNISIFNLLEIYEKKSYLNNKKILLDFLKIKRGEFSDIYDGRFHITIIQSIVIKIMFVWIIIMLITSFYDYKKIQKNKFELDNIRDNKKINTNREDIYLGKSKDNIYGVDFQKMDSILYILGDKLMSLDATKDEIEFEFMVDNRNDIDNIVGKDIFKDANLVSIYEKDEKIEILEKIKIKENLENKEKNKSLNDNEILEKNNLNEDYENKNVNEKTIKKEKLIKHFYIKGRMK